MEYCLYIDDAAGRRIAQLDSVPLLEAVRDSPDGYDYIRGLVPAETGAIAPGYTVRLHIGGALFCAAKVRRVLPQWGDAQRMVLGQPVKFRALIEFEAETEVRRGNTAVNAVYRGASVDQAVRDLINRAPGPVHYTVAHTAFPDGAQQEQSKFDARRNAGNELGFRSIATGQWAGGGRIDRSTAYAKDGDTIAGLKVDGVAWPDVRLMLIDCEETSRNSHAISRHPEVAAWSESKYSRSGYKLKADAARAALQALIDAHGISHIELNPHRDLTGSFDDRIDAYGRYLALVYGGGLCFNAAMVEQGHADIYLYEDGRYHEPSLALKEFYSYTGANTDSIAAAENTLADFEANGGLLEMLAALAYAAGGYTFSVGESLAVRFGPSERPANVIAFEPERLAVVLGSDMSGLANRLVLRGNPFTTPLEVEASRGPSIEAYGLQSAVFDFFSVSTAADAELLAEGLLDDLAYPATEGKLLFYHGESGLQPGAAVELRGPPLRRVSPGVAGEWGERFAGRFAGRVMRVRHRLAGRSAETEVTLGPPLRSVNNPLEFIARSQERGDGLFQFRLDDPFVGLDIDVRLDE